MKKLTLLLSATALAAVLAIPAGASADVTTARPDPDGAGPLTGGESCDYARSEGAEAGTGGTDTGSVAGDNVEVIDNDGTDVVPGAQTEQVIVYANVNPTDDAADNGGAGVSDDADAAAGACVNLSNGMFDGGTLEAGAGNPTAFGPGAGGPLGGYVIAYGDNDNDAGADPTGASDGYIGVSNFETDPAAGDQCEVPDAETGGGTNSGGCLTVRSGPNTGNLGTIGAYPVPLLACGDDSSAPAGTWEGSSRDGCTLPE